MPDEEQDPVNYPPAIGSRMRLQALQAERDLLEKENRMLRLGFLAAILAHDRIRMLREGKRVAELVIDDRLHDIASRCKLETRIDRKQETRHHLVHVPKKELL